MNETSFQEQLTRILTAQVQLSGDLLALLQQEYEILCTAKLDNLENLVEQKKPIMVDLENLGCAWELLLKNRNVELSMEGISQFLNKFDHEHNTELLSAWTTLLEKTRLCKEKNTVNGTVINIRNQATQQVLALLRGQKPEDRMYNHHGCESSLSTGGKSLAKA